MFAVLAEDSSELASLGLDDFLETGRRYLVDHAPDVAISVLAAAAIFLVGNFVVKFATRLLVKALIKARFDETLARFLGRVVHAFMFLWVTLLALGKLGIDTTSFTAVVAAAGLAIGLALQGSLSNFAAGVMIILFRPFKVGDFVEAGGAKGLIEEIHIFHTMLRTPDNIQLVVPNGAITGGNISNYSAKPTRRIDLVVGCGYSDDLQAVKQFLAELVNNDMRVLRDPEPVVAVGELGDNCVNFIVRPWVANADYWAVRWDLTEAIKTGFDLRGFQIPFPQRDLHVYQGEPAEVATDLSRAASASTESSAPENAPPTSRATQVDDWFKPRRVG